MVTASTTAVHTLGSSLAAHLSPAAARS
jgi:hypothetical protein